MKQRIYLLVLGVIIFVAAIIRLYNLSVAPPALNWDEVAMGYNAYSILKTGHDEYGTFLPKYFRSFDDYKRPAYVYSLVPSVAVFGLTEFAVRFPSALFGILSVIVVYLLVIELFDDKRFGLVAAGVLAILPWQIQFSRGGFEVSAGLLATLLGVLLTLYGFRRNVWYLPIAALAFGISLYSYLGQRGVVPVLTVVLLIVFRKKIFQKDLFSKKGLPILLAILITGVFWVSIAADMTNATGTLRYKATNIFDKNEVADENLQEIQYDGTLGINKPRRVFHSNIVVDFELLTRGYLTHFSPDYFFFERGQQQHEAPREGLLFIWMLPFTLLGLFALVRKKHLVATVILGAWLFSAPIASAFTYQVPHAMRAAEMIVPITIVVAMGIYLSFSWLKKYNFASFIGAILLGAAIVVFFFAKFLHQYFVHIPQERAPDWAYGRKQMVEYIQAHKNSYQKIVISTKLDWSYIFVLFYTKYDPAKYLAEGGTKSGGFDEQGNKFDSYEFHTFDFTKEPSTNKILYVGSPNEFPDDVKPVKTIAYPNGMRAIEMVEK